MRMPQSLSDISILDADTYANGDPATYGLPLDQFEFLRSEAPCYRQEFDDPRLVDWVWVITRHADCEAVDRDNELWAANRGSSNIWAFAPIGDHVGKPSMITSDGEDHSYQRHKVSRFFRPGSAKRLEDRFRGYARDVVSAALAKGEPIDFVQDIAHVMPMQALGDVLGVPVEDRARFFGWVDTFASAFDPRMAQSFEDVAGAINALYDYALELAALKRSQPGEDALTLMVTDESGERLPDNTIQGNVTLLASGAAESTRSSLSHGMEALMRNPEQMAWLRERADDIPSTAVQEILRIASPFTHLVRIANADTEVAGQEIKEGERVAMMFASANFDPDVFDDPRSFDLSRDPNPHMTFGRGPHACLGKHVAALEIKVLLEELLQRTRDIRPAGEISYMREAYSRSVYSLPVELVAA